MVTATPQAGVEDVAFEPLSAAFAQNPYPAYAALRDKGTPQFFADFDMWLVTRFDDVAAIARDISMVRSPEFFMSAEEVHEQKRLQNWLDMPHHERFVQFSMLDSDGEVHDRLRKQVFREFTPAFIARQRTMIQSFVDKLIDSLIDKGEIDFVEDLAAQVPGHIIGRVLGVPDEDCPQLRGWSEKVVQFFDINRTDERKALAEQATTEFYHYLKKLMAERRKAPQEDLITRLMVAQDAGHLNEDELVSTCMLILMAGHGSTIDVLGSGMHALLRFPDQMARLKADPGLIHTAIQEMFRFESPLPFFHRYSTTDCVVGSQAFPRGTKFGLLYGAANRDPAAFGDNADSFDVGRNPNRHLAFGGGAHFCLGNHLARLDMEVIFTTLIKRLSSIELVDAEPQYKRGLSVRGPKTLRLALTPA
ncbi:cytochrome P450 [Mesorhizobium sp. ANAO-SY3R2]|uniref:cytochrome P450 n=1 Tax=Mesorhizobium sp. ANAO-SY3R2 TaxID=3166644 RepID=UPI003671AF6A